MLAFWMGGACFHYIEPPPIPYTPETPEDITGAGVPAARHQRGERDRIDHGERVIDDDEILEFLRLWVLFNDTE